MSESKVIFDDTKNPELTSNLDHRPSCFFRLISSHSATVVQDQVFDTETETKTETSMVLVSTTRLRPRLRLHVIILDVAEPP